jgi:hypothetical protein
MVSAGQIIGKAIADDENVSHSLSSPQAFIESRHEYVFKLLYALVPGIDSRFRNPGFPATLYI